ncbi:MAG: 8-amino-7-oxononanoate synthase [Armatimonadota bacterium]
MHLDEELRAELDDLSAQGLLRTLRTASRAGPRIEIAGRPCLNLCSNDYLGLTQHPAVIAAAAGAVQRYGSGAGASRLISGTLPIHEELEQTLADFKGTEAAMVFTTGHAANLGTIPALVGRGDLVICDKLNHASLIDACRLSGARLRVYGHGDLGKLASLLGGAGNFRRTLVVTDGVFSMDGDIAPLRDILSLADEHGARVMVDDAHGTGVMGPDGRGTAQHVGLPTQRFINMGTLSKALGSLGGYIAGSGALISYLHNRARSFIYSTALPPASAGAALAALRVVREHPEIRARLWRNVGALRGALRRLGLTPVSEDSHINAVVVREAETAVRLSEALLDRGAFVAAIRPPTVPQGTSRLRITVTAAHTLGDIEQFAGAMKEAFEEVGLPDG